MEIVRIWVSLRCFVCKGPATNVPDISDAVVSEPTSRRRAELAATSLSVICLAELLTPKIYEIKSGLSVRSVASLFWAFSTDLSKFSRWDAPKAFMKMENTWCLKGRNRSTSTKVIPSFRPSNIRCASGLQWSRSSVLAVSPKASSVMISKVVWCSHITASATTIEISSQNSLFQSIRMECYSQRQRSTDPFKLKDIRDCEGGQGSDSLMRLTWSPILWMKATHQMLNMAWDQRLLRKKSTIREGMAKNSANASMINITTSSLPNFSCVIFRAIQRSGNLLGFFHHSELSRPYKSVALSWRRFGKLAIGKVGETYILTLVCGQLDF